MFIVTPSFNAASTIERTIISVVTQAGDFELSYHIQDGGSTDATLAILNRWKSRLDAGEYPIQCKSIKFSFESKPDNGMYDAIVRGFDKFTIPRQAFMTWINADDLLMPGALALVHQVASSFTEEQVSWLAGAACVIKNNMSIMQVERPTPTCAIWEGMCDGKHWHFVQQEGVFFRNWLWRTVDSGTVLSKYKLSGDWNLWRLFAKHAEFIQVPWPLGGFCLREGQLSQVNAKAYMDELDATVSPQSRLNALKALGDSGGAKRRILRARYPSGDLMVVEKSADGQTHFYYQKNFEKWPSRPLDDKGGQSETIVFEANSKVPNGVVPPVINSPLEAVPPKPEFFGNYTYAKRSHWKFFEGVDVALFGATKDLDAEQLKVYQDLLVLRFIRDNVPAGSRILDVGGGISRILAHLAKTYECWNIDKLEGVGNGPRALKDPPYRLVRDYMGNFNQELPDNYFDLVFSISALEHVPQQEESLFKNIVSDINRVLKPGGLSLHLFDIVLKQNSFWTNKFTDYIFRNVDTINKSITSVEMRGDPDFYAMSEAAYNKTWFNSTKKPYLEHGQPSSLNILWRKEDPYSKETGISAPCPVMKVFPAAKEFRFFVVTPCLNVAETIDKTIASVINQAGEYETHYHVQDGGSTDGTLDKLRYWDSEIKTKPSYKNIRFTWDSCKDAGMYAALQQGFDSLQIAPDDFMTWINGDDVLMPETFAVVAKTAATEKNINWIGGPVRVIDMSDKVIFELATPTPTQVIRAGLCDGKHWRHLQQEGMFFRKSLWFRSKHALSGFRYAGDWRLWQEFAKQTDYYQTDKSLGSFRSRPGQLSKEFKKEYEAELDNFISEKERVSRHQELSSGMLLAAKVIIFTDSSVPKILEIPVNISIK